MSVARDASEVETSCCLKSAFGPALGVDRRPNAVRAGLTREASEVVTTPSVAFRTSRHIVIAAPAAYPAGMSQPAMKYAERFRGFLPVVIDVETGGFDCERDALLEIAVIVVCMDE